jgi:hypothetical protein
MDATTEQPVNPGRLEATIHDTGGDDHAARLQRAPEGAGQSAGGRGHQMVQGGGV